MAPIKRTAELILIAVITALCCSVAVAASLKKDPIVLPPAALPHAIGQDFQYLVDAQAELDIAAVRGTPDEDWRSVDSANANFGFTTEAYWFRGAFHNTSPEQTEWLLELGYPLLDYIDVYFFQGDQLLEHYVSGDRYVFAQRPLEHRHFLFPFLVPENESVSVYIRIHTSSAVQIPLKVTTQERMFQTEQMLIGAHGVYFGAIGVMLFYNLFIYFTTRGRAYLLYVLFVFSVGGFQLNLHGFAYQLIWPGSPWLQDKMVSMFVGMCSLSLGAFTISFLNLREYSTKLYRLLALITVAGGVLAVLAFMIPYQHAIQLAAALGFFTVIVCLSSGFYVWYRGYKPAIHYSIAFTALLSGTALMILNKFGVLPLNAVTENAQQIGSLAQLVLLSFALAFRIKVLRDATEEAQLEATIRLEHRVKERTLELEEANQKLQQLSSLDPLTGVFNRRFLDANLDTEWKRAMREQSPISVIMLDIDHFKSFNDQYGHQVGDDCLCFLVRQLMASVLRTPDMVVRFGGEEFAVVLPSTDSDGAVTVAERIKDKLDRNPFPIGEAEIRITVSQGIATMVPQVHEEPDMLISRADQTLYKAKEEGRDRFLVHEEANQSQNP